VSQEKIEARIPLHEILLRAGVPEYHPRALPKPCHPREERSDPPRLGVYGESGESGIQSYNKTLDSRKESVIPAKAGIQEKR